MEPLVAGVEKEFAEADAAWHRSRRAYLEGQAREAERQAELVQEAVDAEKRSILEAEQRLREEERKRLAREAMKPEERLVEEIRQPKSTENRVVAIFNQIDELPEAGQKMVAFALKEFWIAKGKWKKKDCTAKQWAKVQKVTSIIGES